MLVVALESGMYSSVHWQPAVTRQVQDNDDNLHRGNNCHCHYCEASNDEYHSVDFEAQIVISVPGSGFVHSESCLQLWHHHQPAFELLLNY